MVNVSSSSLDRLPKKLQKTSIIRDSLIGTPIAKRTANETVELKRGQVEMKKGLVAIFCLLVLTFASLPASAQTRYRRYDNGRRYEQRTGDWRYQDRVYNGRRWDRDRGFWDEHRDKLTTGIGAGAGALLGSAIGGTKGAIIGAIVGGGGAAAYTYGIRDKDNRRHRRY
jgi:hypothetical protein